MAMVGAQRAAELTGRSKSTIQRAMNAGKLSFTMDNNNRRVIDVAELERAFGLVPQGGSEQGKTNVESEIEKAAQTLEIERLKMRIRMLEDQLDMSRENIEDLKSQRDQWQKQAQQVLLTSQYSQKQAEELKAELKERERKARERQMQRRMQQAAQNENRQIGPIEKLKQEAKAFDIQNLWRSIRGNSPAEEKPAEEKATA